MSKELPQVSAKIISENYKQIFLSEKIVNQPLIMANLQDEAINDTSHLQRLTKSGTGIFRINCSFGDYNSWRRISENIKNLNQSNQNQPQLLFDLSGKKVRIESVFENGNKKKDVIIENDDLVKVLSLGTIIKDKSGINLVSNLKSEFLFCKLNDIVRFDDSKMSGHIINAQKDFIQIKIDNITGEEFKLSEGKGINFPDRILPTSGLSIKDKKDISFMMQYGDILCLSFIQNADDILEIKKYISTNFDNLPPIVIKIETNKAVENFTEILDASSSFPKVAILVARGDLVSECGWANLAQIQEDIYLKSRAAHLPVILATGILEEFIQTGIPTRAEVLDFHYARKFDCILINKGKFMCDVIEFCNNQ